MIKSIHNFRFHGFVLSNCSLPVCIAWLGKDKFERIKSVFRIPTGS